MSADQTTLDEKVGVIAQEENVPYEVFRRLIFQESSDSHFDKNGNVKRSSKGAMGYGQLMPATAAELGVDPTDPMDNLRGAAMYLRQMLDRYDGNVQLALAAYNAGPGNVDRFGGVPPFKETRNYVSTILGIKQDLLTPSMEEISAKFVENDRGLDGYTVRPQLRPEEPEMVQDPYAAAIAEAIQYQPPEKTTGIGAFEQFMPADREASDESEELGPVDLKAIGEEEANMYNRYNTAPMTFQQARTAERKAMSGGIGPLNYIARNMYG